MKKVLNSITSQADTQLEELGLTFAQWFPLKLLSQKRCSTALSMAKELAMDAGALTRALHRLEVKGFISRARSVSDRRIIQIEITTKGLMVAQQVPQVLAEILNGHLGCIEEEKRNVFIETLSELACQVDLTKMDPHDATQKHF
jgi:DNA-binding MarR family transcriptional regulator